MSDEKVYVNKHTGLILSPTTPEELKHEKIEKLAWELYMRLKIEFETCEGASNFFDRHTNKTLLELAWENAEEFYNYAKEKEGEE